MGHIEKHLKKTDDELVLRLFKEWKLYSGCLYDNTEELIREKLLEKKFNYPTQEVITLCFEKPMGFGYSRKLEKIISNFVKVVVAGTNESYEIITAYPDLERGITTKEYFLFKEKMVNDEYVWNLFTDLYDKHLFDIRLVLDKKPYLKITLHNFSIKIKNSNLTIIDSTYYNPKNYVFTIPNGYSSNDIAQLLLDIENFKETYSLFRNNTIENFVSGRLI